MKFVQGISPWIDTARQAATKKTFAFQVAMPHIPVMLSGAPRSYWPPPESEARSRNTPRGFRYPIPCQGIFSMRLQANGTHSERIPWGGIPWLRILGVFRLRAWPHRGCSRSRGAPLNMTEGDRFDTHPKSSRGKKDFGRNSTAIVGCATKSPASSLLRCNTSYREFPTQECLP